MGQRFPFPDNPTGWYRVAFADEVRPNEIASRTYFGMELIAFRTEDGTAHVMEAHCPHLGAHIGVGGSFARCRAVADIGCGFHNPVLALR